jgi:hypothetical protein
VADRYWVGGTGNWSSTGKWSTTSGGASGASVPTAADNAIFDANSGSGSWTATVDATAACLDLNMAAAGGTPTLAGSASLAVSGSVSLKAGMTASYAGILTMNATSGTKTITTNGVSLSAAIVFNGAGATFQLADNVTFVGAGSGFNLTAGSFDPNGTTVSLVGTSHTLNGLLTFFNLTRTGTAAKTDLFTIASNITVTGTLTITGNSAINRVLVRQSATPGTPVTITAAAVTLSNCDFIDIVGAGVATWSGTLLGDCGGNSGITFEPSVTQTATGTASFTWSTHGWTTRVPLPQDDVVIPNSFIAGRSITFDMPRAGRSITFTCTGNPSITSSIGTLSFGSFLMASGMTGVLGSHTVCGRGSYAIGCAGTTPFQAFGVSAPGGTYILQDALTVTGTATTGITVNIGTLNTNGMSVTTGGRFTMNGGDLILGASTVTLTGAANATPWNFLSGTIDAGTSTIKLTDATSTQKNFVGNGRTYYNLWLAAATRYVFTHSNTFNEVRADAAGAVVQFTAGTTQTVNSFTVNGATAVASDRKFGHVFNSTSSWFSTPDTASHRITGDIELRACVAAADWTPSATQAVLAKQGNRYMLRVNTNGTLIFTWFDGAVQQSATSLGVVAASDGAPLWIRATLDVDNGAAGYDVKFYTSTDAITTDPAAVSWSQLGATVTGVGTTAIGSYGVNDLTVGLSSTGPLFDGRIYRAQVLNGIGGTVVADFNPNDYGGAGSATWASSTTGETWTKNGFSIVSATNQVAICSATAASHTLTKAGGGQVICENVSVNRSTAGPGSSFIAISSNSIDGGNNSGWVFGGYTDAIGTSAGGSAVTGVADSDLGVTPLRDREPESFRAGDTLVWTKSLSDYSAADGWVLAYRFISPTSKFDLTTSAYGTDHLVVSFASAAFAAGTYTWQAYVTRADERFTVGKGTCKVLPNLADVTDPGYDDRSFNRKALDALDAGLEQYGANAHVHQYSVEGRTMTYRTFADFMAARDRLRQEVAREDAAQRARAGGTRRNQVRVKFT